MIFKTAYNMKPPLSARLIPGHPINVGRVGCWLMNERGGKKIFDLSSNGNTGTLVGDTHFVPSKFGTALEFDNVGDVANLGNNTSLHILGDITIRFTIKYGALAGYKEPMGHGQYNENGWYLQNRNTGALYYYTSQSAAHQFTYSNTGVFVVGEWADITISRKGTKATIYKDAINVTNTYGTHTDPLTPTYDFVLNGKAGLEDGESNSVIDSVDIWNRDLSASEIAALYINPFMGIERRARPELIYQPAVGISIPVIMNQLREQRIA